MNNDFRNRVSPQNITSLKQNEIFVFGSNLAGIHGAGAARTANKLFGAQYGIGIGPTGQSYAIPTKDKNIKTISLEEIEGYISNFEIYVEKNPNLDFLVTEIGCGLAGFTPAEIAPLFKYLTYYKNVFLPQRFIDILALEI